jgi:hypothetical protein
LLLIIVGSRRISKKDEGLKKRNPYQSSRGAFYMKSLERERGEKENRLVKREPWVKKEAPESAFF